VGERRRVGMGGESGREEEGGGREEKVLGRG
jgi:hypothetical protein